MRPTLFHIPHELFGIPLFGVGWALTAWVVVCIGLAVFSLRRVSARANETEGKKSKAKRSSEETAPAQDLFGMVLVMGLLGGVIVFLLPMLEAEDPNGNKIGLPLRGYGLLLLIAVVSGVTLAAWRAQQVGMHPDVIYALALWLFVAGIVGARLFYVIQYWQNIQQDTLLGTLRQLVSFTEGGLVVYGALMGGLLAYLAFCWRHKAPVLALGDLIAPSMALGLAIGRWGCLMNGCCFGGVCHIGPAIRFPQASQPYVHQARNGQLVGMNLEHLQKSDYRARGVRKGSLADKAGVKPGDKLALISPLDWWKKAVAEPEKPITVLAMQRGTQPDFWRLKDLPSSSLPVHPAQIYSSINALLICFVLLAVSHQRLRDGVVLATMLTIYPITRTMLEIIRSDEPGRFGTALTISQWVSIVALMGVAALWAYVLRQPSGQRADLSRVTV